MTTDVRQPDLSVYYDAKQLNAENIETSETKLTQTQVTIISLYTSPDITQQIGYRTLNSTAYIESKIEIVRDVNNILVLPFGTLSFQRTAKSRELLKLNAFFIPVTPISTTEIINNAIVTYTIVSGNGDFLGSKGYVTITSDDTSIRRIDVWLDK